MKALKTVWCLTGSVLLILSLASCGASGHPPAADGNGASQAEGASAPAADGGAKTLRLLGPGLLAEVGENGVDDPVTGVRKPGFGELVELFHGDYPNVTLDVTPSPWENWVAVLQTAVASNSTDIVMHGASLTDLVIDLDPYLERDPHILEALASPPETYRLNDDRYRELSVTGISYVITPYYALVDRQLFADFGVPAPDKSWTWDDLLDLAERTTGENPRTGEPGYGVYLFNITDASNFKPFTCVAAGWGVKTFSFDSDGKYDISVSVDSPEAVRVFSYLNDLARFTPPGFLEMNRAENIGMEENNIAIYMDENPQYSFSIVSANGLEDRFDYLPLPVCETGEAAYSSFTGTNSMAISKTAAEPDLAWEFIKWLVTDEEAQDWMVRTASIPASASGIAMLEEKDLPYFDAVNSIFGDFFDNCFVSQSEAFYNLYGTAQSAFGSSIMEMYNGNITPEECAQSVQAAIQEYQRQNR